MHYTAEIQHSRETIHRLSRVQYNQFRLGTKFFWGAISIATLLGAAFNSENKMLFYMLLFAGCWLISNADLSAKHLADKIVEAAKGDLPHSEYHFQEHSLRVISGDYDTTLPYQELFALVEDKEYFYLFINRNAGYMVPKQSLEPSNLADFRTALQKASGQKFRKPTTFFNMSLPRIRQSFRKK